MLRPDFATSFGFTEPEVEALLERAGQSDRLATVRSWYNGYVFGGTVVYNPWSILNHIDSPEPEPRPFWVSTSGNDLVRESLIRHASQVEKDIEALLSGDGIERRLDENVVLSDLGTRSDTLFSLLTFSGYLRADKIAPDPDEEPHYRLSIPNREVRQVYTSTFREWMRERLGGESAVERLKQALLEGDAEAQALSEGLTQIRERGYASALVAAGASPVHAFAVAFDGKTVRVEKA